MPNCWHFDYRALTVSKSLSRLEMRNVELGNSYKCVGSKEGSTLKTPLLLVLLTMTQGQALNSCHKAVVTLHPYIMRQRNLENRDLQYKGRLCKGHTNSHSCSNVLSPIRVQLIVSVPYLMLPLVSQCSCRI